MHDTWTTGVRWHSVALSEAQQKQREQKKNRTEKRIEKQKRVNRQKQNRTDGKMI